MNSDGGNYPLHNVGVVLWTPAVNKYTVYQRSSPRYDILLW